MHLITYDLRKPGQKYDELYKRIKSYGAYAHPLESVWLIMTTQTPEQVYDHLRPVLDDSDRLFVVNITGAAHRGWLDQSDCIWIGSGGTKVA